MTYESRLIPLPVHNKQSKQSEFSENIFVKTIWIRQKHFLLKCRNTFNSGLFTFSSKKSCLLERETFLKQHKLCIWEMKSHFCPILLAGGPVVFLGGTLCFRPTLWLTRFKMSEITLTGHKTQIKKKKKKIVPGSCDLSSLRLGIPLQVSHIMTKPVYAICEQ